MQCWFAPLRITGVICALLSWKSLLPGQDFRLVAFGKPMSLSLHSAQSGQEDYVLQLQLWGKPHNDHAGAGEGVHSGDSRKWGIWFSLCKGPSTFLKRVFTSSEMKGSPVGGKVALGGAFSGEPEKSRLGNRCLQDNNHTHSVCQVFWEVRKSTMEVLIILQWTCIPKCIMHLYVVCDSFLWLEEVQYGRWSQSCPLAPPPPNLAVSPFVL